MQSRDFTIPYETYQRLIDHLSIHAETDAWAKQLLTELQQLKESQNNSQSYQIWLSNSHSQN